MPIGCRVMLIGAHAPRGYPPIHAARSGPLYGGGKIAELFGGPLSAAVVNEPWTLWQKEVSPSPPGPQPPQPPPPVTQPFEMAYRLANQTVTIRLPVAQNVTVEVWVDATTDAVRVSSTAAIAHRLKATLEVWRNETGPYPFGGTSWCTKVHPSVVRHPDTVVSGVVWFGGGGGGGGAVTVL